MLVPIRCEKCDKPITEPISTMAECLDRAAEIRKNDSAGMLRCDNCNGKNYLKEVLPTINPKATANSEQDLNDMLDPQPFWINSRKIYCTSSRVEPRSHG